MFIRSHSEHIDPSGLSVDAQAMRAHNASLLLRLVWSSDDGVSRADLSRLTGLSRSTISAIVAELLDAELVAHLLQLTKGLVPEFRDIHDGEELRHSSNECLPGAAG